MPFSEEVEIPPIFTKILKRIEEKGQVDIEEFKTIILNLRISREDMIEVEKYLQDNKLIQRIPNLVASEHGGAKDVIVSTMTTASLHVI